MAGSIFTNCDRICEHCGATFRYYDSPCNAKHGRGRFCSKRCQDQWKTIPLETRFRGFLGEPMSTGCVLWTGSLNDSGYGIIPIGRVRDGTRRVLSSHRVAWELANGPIPEGMQVLHRCDIRNCCEPKHLFLGTNAENVADRVAKKRTAMGERSGASKLTTAMVLEIRARYAAGETNQAKMARGYDLGENTVRAIIKRKTWKHV